MATPPSQSVLNLLAFLRVVEAGSFAEAARRQGVSTSALSKAVARFERGNNVRLLHRTTHAISLTDDGERLIEAARDLTRDVERLEAMLAQAAEGGMTGRVRLSAPGPLVRACLAPNLPALLRSNPGIDLDLKIDDARLDLADEGVDIAIRHGSPDGQPGLVTHKLITFPWLLCASPRYLDAMGGLDEPDDLDRHHQIGFRDAATGQLMAWQFCRPGSNGDTIKHVPRNRLVVEDMTTIWSMVVHGLGIAWLPAWCGLEDLRAGRVVELLEAWRMPETIMYGARLRRTLAPRRTAAVLEELSIIANAWRYPS